MPQKVATAIAELNLIGAEYAPIAYLGSQLVNGVNHGVDLFSLCIGDLLLLKVFLYVSLVLLKGIKLGNLCSELVVQLGKLLLLDLLNGALKYWGSNGRSTLTVTRQNWNTVNYYNKTDQSEVLNLMNGEKASSWHMVKGLCPRFILLL